MAKKLVVRSDEDAIWVINLDEKKVKKLKDEGDNNERQDMLDSLVDADEPIVGVQNAIMGDDPTEFDPNTGNERLKG